MFWKKDKIEFKRGDSVKLKKGVIHPRLKIEISDWHGRVIGVEGNAVEVELDSITLKNMSDETLNLFNERAEYPYIIIYPEKDLEHCKARDKYEDVEIAQDVLIEKMEKGENIPFYKKLSGKWIRHFRRSEYYFSMNETDKGHADFVLDTYSNYMYDYERKTPRRWTVISTKEGCLHLVPTKITGEKDLFESYGEVLLNFFHFLEERKYYKSRKLQELIIEIKGEIVVRSQDSSKWGMAKSFMMGAVNSGFDTNNQAEMNKYLRKQQRKALFDILFKRRKN